MAKVTLIAPPYSLLFISDPDLGDGPEPSGEHLTWTDSAISISCLYWHDGKTKVTLGPADEVGLSRPPVFDGEISTPNQQVIVSTAHLETILTEDVPTATTRVRIWENDAIQPDDIVVGLG